MPMSPTRTQVWYTDQPLADRVDITDQVDLTLLSKALRLNDIGTVSICRRTRPPEQLTPRQVRSLFESARRGENREAVAEQAGQALDSGLADRDPDMFGQAVLTLVHADELTAADAHCLRVQQQAPASRTSSWPALVPLLRARISRARGDLRAAKSLAGGVLAEHDTHGGVPGHLVRTAVAQLVETLVELGELEPARELLRAHRLTGRLPDGAESADLLHARATLKLAGGQPQESIDDYLDCGQRLTEAGVHNPAVLPWRSRAALAALRAHREDLATALAEQELARARRWGTPRAVGTALHAFALTRPENGQLEPLAEAVDLLRLSPTGVELVHAMLDLGRVHCARRDYALAHRRFHTARQLAERCQSPRWINRADQALSQVNRLRGNVRLTKQETRIAQLVRAGYNNRQISEKLYLTRRTVEFHLSGVYRKLGISGRRELHIALPDEVDVS